MRRSLSQPTASMYRILFSEDWYDKCLGHGGSLQDIPLVNKIQRTTTRLVNVGDICLCDVPLIVSYLVLSYVWGTVQDDIDKL